MHVTPSVASALSGLALLVALPLAAGQSLAEFEAERHELRERYLLAGSPGEKQAILERFRRLRCPEMEQADVETPLEILERLLAGVDPAVIESLARGMGIHVGGDPAPTGETPGLGSKAEVRKDPRVAALEELPEDREDRAAPRVVPRSRRQGQASGGGAVLRFLAARIG